MVVWLFRLNDHLASFTILSKRIERLYIKSGPNFLFGYLKECTRMTVWFLAGNPAKPTGKPLVEQYLNGLPKIIPYDLYLLINRDNRGLVLGLLTILSLYRVLSTKPKVKLDSILDPFTGLYQTLDKRILIKSLKDLKVYKLKVSPATLVISEKAGPNGKKATWSSALDAIAFIHNIPVLINLIKYLYRYKSILILIWLIFLIIIFSPFYIIIFFLTKSKLHIGKLSVVYDVAGKSRIVGITNYWVQCAFKPLHNSIFSILKTIITDGTFDQEKPLKRLMSLIRHDPDQVLYSYDLSSATDRLPITLQKDILNLLGHSGDLWASILNFSWSFRKMEVMYSCGQPMGAYSSWGMLALTHHVLVRVAALKTGISHFTNYAILGDDVVIADDNVAKEYRILMESLGVSINDSKSLVSNHFSEFAKKLRGPKIDYTPLGPGLLVQTIRNNYCLGKCLLELMGFFPFSLDALKVLLKDRPSFLKAKSFETIWQVLFTGICSIEWRIDVGTIILYLNSFELNPTSDLLSILNELTFKTEKALRDRNEKMGRNFRFFTNNWYKTFVSTRSYLWILESMMLIVSPGFWQYLLPFLMGHDDKYWTNYRCILDIKEKISNSFTPKDEFSSMDNYFNFLTFMSIIQDLWSIDGQFNLFSIDFNNPRDIKVLNNVINDAIKGKRSFNHFLINLSKIDSEAWPHNGFVADFVKKG